MGFSEEIKIEAAARFADSLRRDFDHVHVRGWARPSSISGATVCRIFCCCSRSASSDEHQRHRAGVEWPRPAGAPAGHARSADPPGRRTADRRQRLDRRRAGDGARPRRACDRHGPQRGIRGGRESRDIGRPATRWSRSSTPMSNWRPITWRSSPPSTPPFATGKILSPAGLLDGTFDLTCRGATTWRCGAGQPGCSAVRPAARHRLAAVDGRALSRRSFPPGGLAGGILRILSRGCRFRVALRRPTASRAAMFPTPGRSTWGAPRWGAGIRKRCAAWRAINCFWRPAIIPRDTCGRSWWPSCYGAPSPFDMGADWRGRAASCRAFAVSRPRGMQKLQKDPELLEQILRANEQFIQSCKSGYVLEAVFSAHRWGNVTHE